MGSHGGEVRRKACVWLVGLLAVVGLVLRLPVGVLAPALESVPLGYLSANWLVANEASVGVVRHAVEYVLVWLLVVAGAPVLYPRGARALTETLRFRVVVGTLTAATAAAIVGLMTAGGGAGVVAGLAVTAVALPLGVTSWGDDWQFATPYVSPVYAVLVSFVPTSQLSEFAALYRMGVDDPGARGAFQLLFGLSMAMFVLIAGTLAALPIVAAPLLELLVLVGVLLNLARRLFPGMSTAHRRRYRCFRRRLRRLTWVTRRVLTAPRGLTSMLLVTAGLLLAGSVVVLAVALAASALQRTPPNGALSFAPAGVLAEWLVVLALFTYAATVGRYWVRVARRLPSLVGVDDGGERPLQLTSTRLGHPVWTQLPSAAALVAALLVLYPAVLPGANPLPALGALVSLTALSFATNWVGNPDATIGSTVAPRVLGTAVVPVAFAVQWLGVSAALVVLPGTSLISVAPTATFVLCGAFGAYVSSDVRAAVSRYDGSDFALLSLVLVLTVCVLFVWTVSGPVRSVLFG